jgi:hypothetical protein
MQLIGFTAHKDFKRSLEACGKPIFISRTMRGSLAHARKPSSHASVGPKIPGQVNSPGRFRPGMPLVLAVLATALCFAVPIIFGHTQLAVASVTTFALVAYLMWRARK